MTISITLTDVYLLFAVPSSIDIGDCLIGGSKVAKFMVRNDGGHGKFCFLPKEKWPATNFKVIYPNNLT